MKTIEETTEFKPKFNDKGLMPCITTLSDTGEVLMLAYMNAESLQKTIETKEAHYWSRSRNELWHKGATSGQIQKVVEIRTDCDQDTILLKVELPGEQGCCHTGRDNCFYREVTDNKTLKF